MSHPRRTAIVLALVLVLASTPLLAAPGHIAAAKATSQIHATATSTWLERATEKARRLLEIIRQFVPQTGSGIDLNG